MKRNVFKLTQVGILLLSSASLGSCITTQAQNNLVPVLVGPVVKLGGKPEHAREQISFQPVAQKNSGFVVGGFALFEVDKNKLDTLLLEKTGITPERDTIIRVDSFIADTHGSIGIFWNVWKASIVANFGMESKISKETGGKK